MKHKQLISILLLQLCFCLVGQAQNYDNIINYSFNGTPTNGVKIKTNLPFSNSSQMPTIHIYGFNYRTSEVIDLSLVYYIYGGSFINYSICSAGGYTPNVSLSNENNKVVIFINDKAYYQRFTVSVYAKGMPGEAVSSNFQGWSIVDQSLNGTNTVLLPYKNGYGGDVRFQGGIWSKEGNVGIGTTTPASKLSVNGAVTAKEVTVTTSGWPDYVFSPDYALISLDTLFRQIKQLGHLPDMPSAKEIETKGQNLGEVNKLLLKKVEELTLYLIRQNKELVEQKKVLIHQTDLLHQQQKLLDVISKKSQHHL